MKFRSASTIATAQSPEPLPHHPQPPFTLASLLRSLRPHQWVKNLLIFVPPLLAHRLLDGERLGHVVLAFLCFSLAASAVYLLNDLADRSADRLHPTKRSRPIAAGIVSTQQALLLAAALSMVAVGISLTLLSLAFTCILVAYLSVTTLYSLGVKRIPIADVIVLCGLYTLRIVAGGVAGEVPVSAWLLAFSMFVFLSLALLKRYVELARLGPARAAEAIGRNYRSADSALIAMMGISSGHLSVVVLALYINSAQVTTLYRSPEILWLACPLMIYWLGRMWLDAYRGEIDEDPVLAAVRDRASYGVGAAFVAVLLAAA